ncbi:MAG: putative collagen-binding domain-containing protein, partial [Bacteroidota bacterium]
PYDRMHHNDGLTFAAGDYILADIGNVYAIYLPNGGSPELEMKDFKAPFRVQWFNPRTGGALQDGSMASVMGGSSLVPLGDPPSDPDEDWVVLVTRE